MAYEDYNDAFGLLDESAEEIAARHRRKAGLQADTMAGFDSMIGNVLRGGPAPTEMPRGEPVAPAGTMFSDPQAANKLRAYTASKYGGAGRYGGAAGYMNDLESAFDARMRAFETMRQRPDLDPVALFEEMVARPTAETQATMAGPLKELEAITGQEQKRRESEMIAQALGLPEGAALSPEGLKTYTGVRGEQRAEREDVRAGQREKRLQAGQEFYQGQQRGKEPPIRAQEARAEQLLAAEGYNVERVGGNYYVMKGRSEVPNSDQLWNDAMQRARQQMTGGAGAQQAHPAVEAAKRAAQMNPNDPRVIQMQRSIAALKATSPEMFYPDGRPKPEAVIEAAKQNFGR